MYKRKKHLCSICTGPMELWYPGATGYGHNAQPVNDGRCCNTCNATIVIPLRLLRIRDGYPPFFRVHQDDTHE